MRFRRKREPNGLAKARAERERSEQRLETVRTHVVKPLQDKARRNQFAEQLRGLMEGGPR